MRASSFQILLLYMRQVPCLVHSIWIMYLVQARFQKNSGPSLLCCQTCTGNGDFSWLFSTEEVIRIWNISWKWKCFEAGQIKYDITRDATDPGYCDHNSIHIVDFRFCPRLAAKYMAMHWQRSLIFSSARIIAIKSTRHGRTDRDLAWNLPSFNKNVISEIRMNEFR